MNVLACQKAAAAAYFPQTRTDLLLCIGVMCIYSTWR